MLEQKFNEIILLVHPLYDVFINILRENPSIVINNSKPTREKDAKHLDILYKRCLAIYGKTILEIKESPKSVMIMIKPDVEDIKNVLIDHNTLKDYDYNKWKTAYDNLIERFVKFGTKTLGRQFIVTEDDIDKRMTLIDKTKYANKVKLKVIGEYKEICVINRMEFLYHLLRLNSIGVSNIEILEERTLFNIPWKGKLRESALPRQERRQLRREKIRSAKILNKNRC